MPEESRGESNILQFCVQPVSQEESEEDRDRRVAETVDRLHRKALLRKHAPERSQEHEKRRSDWCTHCEEG